ncbi:MAG TPA: hypothetical protein VFL47_16400, partial [Flavisolibacter sp.]|nr:hypothetical protein [Flavisolibacter sp.]
MRHFLLSMTMGFCTLSLCSRTAAQSAAPSPKPADSLPSRTFQKMRVRVLDLNDGGSLDSVYVTAGRKSGYTNSNGYIEFDSVFNELLVSATRAGYLGLAKKAKANLTLRLAKKESQSVALVSNGLYERPTEHFSGAVTVVSGADLRKINPVNLIDALKVFAPSLVVVRNNQYGDDPNAPS